MRYETRFEPTMVQRIATRAYALVFVRDPDFVEVSSGVLMLAWGLQLLAPWETFTSATGYRALAVIAPEVMWGGFLVWLGFTQIGAYLMDHWKVRLCSSLGACMVWAFLGVLFGLTNPYGTGIIVYSFLALMTAWVFWRVATARRYG